MFEDFMGWLTRYGNKHRAITRLSAGEIGRAAKCLYYRHKILGTITARANGFS